MRKIILFIPLLLLGSELMHPEDPKSRDHNSLGFGVSGDVALSNGIFYVGQSGSSLNNGSVYIYTPDNKKTFIQTHIQAPIQEGLGYDFGYALDVYENTMVIGAPHRVDNIGRAYIYKKDSKNRWQYIETILPDGKGWSSDFGSKVVINDRHIIIADRYANDERGRVYTLEYDDEKMEWKKGKVIRNDQIPVDGYFGHDIAINGDRMLVGSRKANTVVAYSFSEEWIQTQVLTPNKVQSNGRFGFSIALNDDMAVIGMPGYDNLGHIEVFNLNHGKGESGEWEYVETISNPKNSNRSYFGASIAMDDTEVVIGDYNDESVHIYSYDTSGLTHKQSIDSPGDMDHKFGRAVAIDDHSLFIGATYGEKAFIYTKTTGQSWQMSSVVESLSQNVSITGEKKICSNGKADGIYSCNSIDLMAYLTPKDLTGGVNTELNDIWGWTDPTNDKEYALVGLRNGTSFVDVSDPLNPFVVGHLPTATSSSTWRDIKVYKDHAYIVADNAGNHGVQVFDLSQLRGVTEFKVFTMTNHYTKVGSVHNIHINEATGYAYAVGISSAPNYELKCGGGSHIINLADPANPDFAGCFAHPNTGRSNTGYTHDIQVVVYNGPDTEHQGKEIAFSSNETALSIADLTDKLAPKLISKFDNMQFGYVHQGWLSTDHRYFYVNDELNELRGYDAEQTTVIFDLKDLDNPTVANVYRSGLNTIDHNNYVVGDLIYQSNYSTGLRVINIKNPTMPIESAYFDTYAAGDKISFVGSWSNYPYFSSGTIIMTSIEEGFYVLKASQGGNLSTENEIAIPDEYALKQNYPNPFNPTTQIQYELPKAGEVNITVYNTLGVEVMEIDKGFRSAGIHKVSFNGSDLPSGIYFYQLKVGSIVKTRKMSLIK
ncbi:MAG: choice-of-anchor B family protein [Candidatus Marinimicrobia bacterium]|nr:choice-of-anchor B family protein [Candidatus Neomarinimicrobiota bacterium]